jgi:hypothetical protein
MSDHVDGPRSIGEPAADLTDLFAFTSPENSGRTVLAMCVFPYAGENAIFSNVIDYSIVVRRVTLAGVGNAARSGFGQQRRGVAAGHLARPSGRCQQWCKPDQQRRRSGFGQLFERQR